MANPQQEESERLLSTTHTASPRTSLSDDDTLADDRDGSLDLQQLEHDRKLLEEEEEREKLLAGGNRRSRFQEIFSTGTDDDSPHKAKKSRRKTRRDRGRGRGDEVSELMYEMEEGGEASNSDASSRASSESDEKRLLMVQSQKVTRKRLVAKRFLIFGSIFVLFFALVFAAYKATNTGSNPAVELKFSNGTAKFAATTILISLDGFRADFLTRGLTPTLNSFVQGGVSPKYMNPSFPSLTFPNHYTLATGLHPESHGIVGNTFWDPAFKEEFYYTHPAQSLQPKWWGGEPLWETAERQGVRSAIHMWPGSEANIGTFEPAYVDKFNGTEELSVKVKRILGLLDLPGPNMPTARADQPRPQLIAAYVPNVDADGHRYGPNSTEIRATIQKVDSMIGDLFQGLEERNLTDIVNVVVVSDHGMATTDVTRLIQLDDLVDPDLLEHIDGWPLYGLRPKNPADLEGMYQQILEKTKDKANVDVYLRDKNMPERYHFSNNERIAPLWLVPKTGWAIVKKKEFDVQKAIKEGTVYQPRGLHGYDNQHPLMRAIFIARGPAFPHKPGSRVEPFQNIELYNIICDSLSIEPMPNNGTLRLPLKPVGLHSDPEAPQDETPDDPPTSSASVDSQPTEAVAAATATQSSVASSSQTDSAATSSLKTPTAHTDVPEPAVPARPTIPPQPSESPQSKNPLDPDFWKWFFDKWEKAKDWASGVYDKLGGGGKNGESAPAETPA